jgi:hypothetical protein
MRTLTASEQESVREIAQRHEFSVDATLAMLAAVANGNGTMAQFSHPEFGGAGQWMRGGMTMVSDMFNDALKARVAALCIDLADLMSRVPSLSKPSASWWPSHLGSPDTAGSQNDMRYAIFASKRRLAVDRSGTITVYDTLGHRIHGVSQQQSVGGTVTFASQHGPVDLDTLPVVPAR